MLAAQVIGNIGGDPESKYSANGSAYLRFNVASNFRARSQAGAWEDRTEWVRVTVFGKRAESLAELLRKGMRVFVAGRLEAKPWTSNQGEVKAGLELIADTVEFMSQRNEDGQQQARPATPGRPQRGAGVADDDDLDSVPF